MIPVQYLGWMLVVLALLRFNNKAYLDVRWKLAFSLFTALFSLGKLAEAYAPDLENILNILSVAAFLLPFAKVNYSFLDLEKISDTALLLGMSIIVLLS